MRGNVSAHSLAAALSICLAEPGPGQPPRVQWTRTFRGKGEAGGSSLAATRDGGFIVAGWTSPAGGPTTEYYLVKTDSLELLQWERWYGGARNAQVYSVTQTSDGGFVFAGEKNEGACLCRTDSMGNLRWERNHLFQGDTCIAWASGVRQTADGGFIVTAMASGDYIQGVDTAVGVFLIKTDSAGNRQWRRGFPEDWTDEIGIPVERTNDGGFVLAFFSESDGRLKLIKTDSVGNTIWTKEYTNANTWTSSALAVTTAGGYVVAGPRGSDTSESDPSNICLLMTDSAGGFIRKKNIGSNRLETGLAVSQTTDRWFLIAGEREPPEKNSADAYLVKTDSLGSVLWTRTYDAGGNGRAMGVLQAQDGGIVMAGEGMGNHVFLQKLARE